MKKLLAILILPILLFTACGGPSIPDENKIEDLWELSFDFDFGMPLLRKDTGSDDHYDFYNANDPMQGLFYVSRITDFERTSEGLGDEVMTKSFHDDLASAEDPCSLIHDLRDMSFEEMREKADLHLYLNKPVLCSSQKKDDVTMLSMAGFGLQHEGVTHLGTMLLIVRPEDVVMIKDLVPDSEITDYQNYYDKIVDDFVATHPQIEFPNDDWRELYKLVEETMVEVFDNQAELLLPALEYMDAVASTLR